MAVKQYIGNGSRDSLYMYNIHSYVHVELNLFRSVLKTKYVNILECVPSRLYNLPSWLAQQR